MHAFQAVACLAKEEGMMLQVLCMRLSIIQVMVVAEVLFQNATGVSWVFSFEIYLLLIQEAAYCSFFPSARLMVHQILPGESEQGLFILRTVFDSIIVLVCC